MSENKLYKCFDESQFINLKLIMSALIASSSEKVINQYRCEIIADSIINKILNNKEIEAHSHSSHGS